MDGYLGMLTHNLILVIDIGCCEVYHDVNNEHDVNWNIKRDSNDGIKIIFWITLDQGQPDSWQNWMIKV